MLRNIIDRSFWLNIRLRVLIALIHLSPLILLSSCSTLRNSPKYQLATGAYWYKKENAKFIPVTVVVANDSVQIITANKVSIVKNQNDVFLKKSFDLDILSVPAKFRPTTSALPTQLNTEFNGNVFLGYRFDRFKIKRKQLALVRTEQVIHRAFTFGLFGGLGATQVTPSTTNRYISDEYNGLVFQRGATVMAGINNLTVGLGVGWDYLSDKNRSAWIYQNKPWYGLTLGLNLN